MVLEEALDSPLDCKDNKPTNSKGNQPSVLTGRTFLKLSLQYFGHLMRREDSLEKTLMLGKCGGKRRRRRQRTRWLDSVFEATNMNLTQLWEAVEDRRVWRALVHGVMKSRTRLND